MAYLIDLRGFQPVQHTNTDIPWRLAAQRCRRRNQEAQRLGFVRRSIVGSNTLLSGVSIGDRIVWANRQFLDRVGHSTPRELASVPVWEFTDPRCHATVRRRIDGLGVLATQPRRVRYVLRGPAGLFTVQLYTIDCWDCGGVMARHFVGSVVEPDKPTVYLGRVYSLTLHKSGVIQRIDGMSKNEAGVVLESLRKLDKSICGVIHPTSEATRTASSKSRSA